MKTTCALIMAVFLLLCALSTSAHAEDDPEGRQQRAKTMWEEGVRRYDLGKFDEAIELFLRAYETWPYEPILFNLCQAHRQKADYKKASFYCRAFLRNSPNASNRDIVEELILEMDQRLEEQEATNEKPPEGVERPPGGYVASGAPGVDRPLRPWKWVALGLGVAAVAGGATLIAIHEDPLDENGDQNPNVSNTRPAGIAVAIGGAALIGTGLVLWILDSRAAKRGSRFAVAPTPGAGLVVTLGWEF